jgi:hypothetical protein
VAVTIKKGEDWGRAGERPDGTIVVASDAQARAVIEPLRRAEEPMPPLAPRAGDVARTVGVMGGHTETRIVPWDLGAALLDGRLFWFVSSLVAGEPFRRGRCIAVMNTPWLREWNIAPKAHPNDGLLDVLDMQLSVTQARAAGRRARLGDHLPHPGIEVQRLAAMQLELARPLTVRLDGEVVGRFTTISARIEPDALTVVV